MAHLDYLAEEVAEDWVDGLITRREALRRLAFLGLSMSAAASLLAACAAAASQAPSAPSAPSAAASPGSAPPAASSASGSAASAAPSAPEPPASASASGEPRGTSAAGRPVEGEAVTFPGKRGALQGFFSAAASPHGAMLVIHENRGLTDHIRSVATRLAGDGYSSLAIDLLSEEGGTAALSDPAQAPSVLGAASEERLVSDMQSALDELARRVPGAKLGAIGFCFGGGMVWDLLAAPEPRLSAAVPFYGPAPDAPEFDGDKAAVFAVYAELDSRVNGTKDRVESALKAAGLTYLTKTYPGVDHAFFNDTGGRYSPEQAEAAYADTLAWLRQHLG
jgi:carboxymethylenebutenolidase